MNFEQFNASAEWLVEALFRASWQGAIAAAFVWLCCRVFPKLPAGFKSWLWRLVFLKFVIAFVWVRPIELELLPSEEMTPAFPPGQNTEVQAVTPFALSGVDHQETYSSTVPIAGNVLAFDRTESERGHLHSTTLPGNRTGPLGAPAFGVGPSTGAFSNEPRLHGEWQIIPGICWLSGVLFGLTRLAAQFIHVSRLRRRTVRCADDRVLRLLILLARGMHIARLPRLCVSQIVTRPMLIGLLRPTLIFPQPLIATASPESLRMMIAHELAHIRRADLAWTAFGALVQTIFFFHPLVWLARRESLLAQEMACDALAVRATSTSTASYAAMLVEVVSLPASRTLPGLSLGVAETRKTLERRIRNMKFIGNKNTKVVQFVAATTLLGVLIAVVPLRIIAAKPEPIESRPERTRVSARTNSVRLLEKLREKNPEELRKVLPTLVHDTLLNQYLQDLANARQQYASIKDDYTPDHPELKRFAEVVASIERQIDDRIDGILSGLEIQANLPGVSPDVAANTERESSHEAEDLPPLDATRLLDQLRGKAGTELRQILPTLVRDKLLNELLNVLAQKQQESTALRFDYADEHPKVRSAVNVLAQIHQQIEDRIEGILAALEIQSLIAREERERSRASDLDRTREEITRAAGRSIDVHARTSGIVEDVLVKVGDLVKKGDALLKIDSSTAQGHLRTAEIRAKIAQADLEIAKADFLQAQEKHKIHSKMIEVGRAPVDTLPPNLDAARANLTKAEAQVELAFLERDQAARDIDRFTLRAPVDGVVTFLIHEGYWVPEPGGRILAHIQTYEGRRGAEMGIIALETELRQLKAREADLLKRYKESHPEVRNLRRIINTTERRLRAEEVDSAISTQPTRQ